MQIQICPKCGTEYQAEVVMCADCQIPFNEDCLEADENQLILPADAEVVPVARGAAAAITSIVGILIDHNIPYRIDSASTEMAGSSEMVGEMVLVVQESEFDNFHEILDRLKFEEFPELKDADESLIAGLCPACNAETGDENICPDCGLPLIIDEEDSEH